MCADAPCTDAANARAQRKEQDDAEIAQHPIFRVRFVRFAPNAERLDTAAQVANAHRAGKRIAVHLAERLHLHRAGERHDGVRQQIAAFGQEADNQQQEHFSQHDQLPPVQALHGAEALAHSLRHQHTEGKRAQRDEVVQYHPPLPVHNMRAEQDDVARLRVGEHFAAKQVGIRILQAAGQGQKDGCQERFRHLTVMHCFHTNFLFSDEGVALHHAYYSTTVKRRNKKAATKVRQFDVICCLM